MFATRDLPTCKMLISKHAYIFMKSAAESHNGILHSIVRSNSLFTSLFIVAALEKCIVCSPVLDNGFLLLVWM